MINGRPLRFMMERSSHAEATWMSTWCTHVSVMCFCGWGNPSEYNKTRWGVLSILKHLLPNESYWVNAAVLIWKHLIFNTLNAIIFCARSTTIIPEPSYSHRRIQQQIPECGHTARQTKDHVGIQSWFCTVSSVAKHKKISVQFCHRNGRLTD